MLHPASVWQPEPPQQDWLFRITCHTLDFELFPILRFSSDMESLDDFSAELCQCCRQDSMSRLLPSPSLFYCVDLFRQF